MMGNVVSVLRKREFFSIKGYFQSGGGHLKKKSKFKFGRKIKLTGDITSKFCKIKDETRTYKLTEGIFLVNKLYL